MMNRLMLTASMLKEAKRALWTLNRGEFQVADEFLQAAKAIVREQSNNQNQEEDLNWLYVLNAYLEIFVAYNELWNSLFSSDFPDSWTALQDAIDCIEIVQRFDGPNVALIRDQLIQLEELYPYRIFSSVGLVTRFIECSICGHDIDSDECCHRRGLLYRGRMATGIVRESEMDHIALVTNPDNRRCVMTFEVTVHTPASSDGVG